MPVQANRNAYGTHRRYFLPIFLSDRISQMSDKCPAFLLSPRRNSDARFGRIKGCVKYLRIPPSIKMILFCVSGFPFPPGFQAEPDPKSHAERESKKGEH